MSETLPPRTATGVTLQFVFPFDRNLPRTAKLSWRRRIGDQVLDQFYADLEQSGDSSVVHEQVTFPGDIWVVVGGAGELLAEHTATGEREQRVVINEASRSAAAGGAGNAAAGDFGFAGPDAADDEDADLAAAIRASLEDVGASAGGHRPAAAAPLAASAAAVESARSIASQILNAAEPEAAARQFVNSVLPAASARAEASEAVEASEAGAIALSKRLADAHRAMRRVRSLAAADPDGGAAADGGGRGERVRLQWVLPDGSRKVGELPASASAERLVCQACVLLDEHAEGSSSSHLAVLAGQLGARGGGGEGASPPPTHVLVCSDPRLRVPFHAALGMGAASSGVEAAADLKSLGLWPSALLRLETVLPP